MINIKQFPCGKNVCLGIDRISKKLTLEPHLYFNHIARKSKCYSV